jgi:NAD(P)-dependent dehydrogenase (short-subunit alcohol dehydrogenase family)
LAADGADIVIGEIDLDGAERTAAEVRETGRSATVLRMDVTDDESVQGAIDRAVAERGPFTSS